MIRFDDWVLFIQSNMRLNLRWNYRANFPLLFIVVTEFHGNRSMEFLAEKKIITWLIFIVILFRCVKTKEKNVETVKGRTGKAIPIFQVIRFPVELSFMYDSYIYWNCTIFTNICRMTDAWEAQEMEHAILRKFDR